MQDLRGVSEAARELAMSRFRLIQPHLEKKGLYNSSQPMANSLFEPLSAGPASRSVQPDFIPASGPVRQIIGSEVRQIMRQATGVSADRNWHCSFTKRNTSATSENDSCS